MDGNTTLAWTGARGINLAFSQIKHQINWLSETLSNAVSAQGSRGLIGTQQWQDWQLTQEGDINQGVPGGRRLEVHPAPVDPGLVGPDVLHHEGRGPAEVKVGAVSEHELVTPPRPLVPSVLTRVVAEERKMNEFADSI